VGSPGHRQQELLADALLCRVDRGWELEWVLRGARGLAETLGSVAWASESPERLNALVGTDELRNKALLDTARKKYPDFAGTYSVLSSIVHPNRNAHLLSPRPVSRLGAQRSMTSFRLGRVFESFCASEGCHTGGPRSEHYQRTDEPVSARLGHPKTGQGDGSAGFVLRLAQVYLPACVESGSANFGCKAFSETRPLGCLVSSSSELL
jgi:hypothetical protein